MSVKTNNALRAKYTEMIMTLLKENEEVRQTGGGTFCFPVVDSEGDDNWVEVVVKIPTGTRDGDPYDGYGEAEDYKMKNQAKIVKAQEAAAKKAAKIKKDQEVRAARAAAKAAHKQV